MAHIFEKKSFKKTSISIVFDAGSGFEKEGQNGTMHLMEHLICKNYEDMQDLFIKEGIAWNAYTSEEQVVFWLKGLSSHLTNKIKEEWVKKVLGGLKVTKERFETEKNVVINEYKDYFNDPESGNGLNDLRKYFGTYTAIGKLEDVQNFTYEDAKKIYKEFFQTPANIVEIGQEKSNFGKVNYVEKSEKPFHKIKFKKNHKLPLENVPTTHKSDISFISKKLVSKADYSYLSMALNMLNAGLSSPWTKKIRVENGLTYHCSAGMQDFRDCAVMSFGCVTEKETEHTVINLYDELIANIDRDLTQERYDLMLSLEYVALEETKLLRYANHDDLIRKGLIQEFKNPKKYNLEKVREVAKKYLNRENLELIVHSGSDIEE